MIISPAGADAGVIPGVFVLSTGRCGSTALSLALRRHDKILSLSEYWMAVNSQAFVPANCTGSQFLAMLTRPRPHMSRILTPASARKEFLYSYAPGGSGAPARFTPETIPPIMYMFLPHLPAEPHGLLDELAATLVTWPHAPIEAQHRRLFDWLARRFDRSVWVERSGASLIYAAAIIARFPDAKFIHLFRDGPETALSIRDYPPLANLARVWKENRAIGIDLMKPPFRLGDSALIAVMDRLFARFSVRKPDSQPPISPELAGEFWAAMIRHGLDAMAAIPPDNLLSLSFEALTAEPERHLRHVAEFILPQTEFVATNVKWAGQRAADFVLPPLRAPALQDEARDRLEAACAPATSALAQV